ncbi:MAG: type II toxin-antitoxin system RelE/ParE family toxin [Pyrinomonadaceae bacterium]
MIVVILEDAAEDLESGAQFYESCATGVGDYFLDSILSDLDSLVLFAGVHPIYFQFHRMLSKRFPFGIYYQVEGGVAYVYAIFDLRRDPPLIRKRLREGK